jgi:hypothetical protein
MLLHQPSFGCSGLSNALADSSTNHLSSADVQANPNTSCRSYQDDCRTQLIKIPTIYDFHAGIAQVLSYRFSQGLAEEDESTMTLLDPRQTTAE